MDAVVIGSIITVALTALIIGYFGYKFFKIIKGKD